MIAKIKKGRSFRGILDYALHQEKGYLLATNMSGQNPKELAVEFGQIRRFRPNLGKAVCHVQIALSPEENPVLPLGCVCTYPAFFVPAGAESMKTLFSFPLVRGSVYL